MTRESAIPIRESSQIGQARREATQMAGEAGLDESLCGKAAVVASELATNLIRYTPGGELLLRTVADGSRRWIEILSIDRGPGMKDAALSMEDGFSTGGTSGNGLGAVKRLSTQFDLISSEPAGTVVYSRLQDGGPVALPGAFSWGAVCRPAPRETANGDCFRLAEHSHGLALMVADGLGHGPDAAAASLAAAEVFERDPFAPLPRMFDNMHARLHGTRGGAVSVAQIDAAAGVVKYAGIGNIAGSLKELSGRPGRGLCATNGTLGLQFRKVQEFTYDGFSSGLLVLHSDGLQTRWSLDAYPQLALRHPALIAGVLYRDYVRGRDDATVVVIRLSLA